MEKENQLTEEQIKKLIEDGDVTPGFPIGKYPSGTAYSNYWLTINALEHYVSHDVHNIVEWAYFQYLNDFFCKEVIEKGFKHVVDDRLQWWPQSKERKVKLLEDMIEEIAKIKDEIVLDESTKEAAHTFLKNDFYYNVRVSIE